MLAERYKSLEDPTRKEKKAKRHKGSAMLIIDDSVDAFMPIVDDLDMGPAFVTTVDSAEHQKKFASSFVDVGVSQLAGGRRDHNYSAVIEPDVDLSEINTEAPKATSTGFRSRPSNSPDPHGQINISRRRSPSASPERHDQQNKYKNALSSYADDDQQIRGRPISRSPSISPGPSHRQRRSPSLSPEVQKSHHRRKRSSSGSPVSQSASARRQGNGTYSASHQTHSKSSTAVKPRSRSPDAIQKPYIGSGGYGLVSKLDRPVQSTSALPPQTETVHRNLDGRKRNISAERNQRNAETGRLEAAQEKLALLGSGLAQIEKARQDRQEFASQASASFAYFKDDKAHNATLANVQRWGDPMASMSTSHGKRESEQFATPPNRFGIIAGPRWDGIDRSTGFEAKVLQHANDRNVLQDEFHKWSTEDM